MPQVVIEQPNTRAITVSLSKESTEFGRAEDCDVVLTADEVSRRHARIVRREGKSLLMDLKSLNGTYVNRQRIVERVLAHLDEIWFGSKCRLVYREDARPVQPKEDTAKGQADSKLLESMSKIRAEMESVGNSMTLIGGRTVASARYDTPAPKASEEELLKMGRAYRRIAALYQASQVMSANFDLGTRLGQVMDIVLEVMGADRGFVLLRKPGSDQLTVEVARKIDRELDASSPSMGIAGRAAIDGEPVLMRDRMTDEEFGGRDSIIMSQITSAMCVPLRVDERILGSIYLDTRKPGVSFTEEDLELFASLGAQAAMAVDNVQLHDRVVEAEKKRQNLGRFLSPAIVEKIVNEDTTLTLGGKKTTVTTMFCDIRGSSMLAEKLAPQQLVNLLNEHFTAMTEIIFKFQGTLDKYIGDEIMAVFGAPLAHGGEALRAVSAAMAIQKKAAELNQVRRQEGRPELEVGIGVDTGEAIAGYIGSPIRMEFTVVGDRVNTAKRFCDMAAGGSVVVGDTTWDLIRDHFRSKPIGTVMLKGKAEAVRAHEIIDVR